MYVSFIVDCEVLVWGTEKEGSCEIIGKFLKEADVMQTQLAICTWIITIYTIKDVPYDCLQTIIQLQLYFPTKVKVQTHIYWIPHNDRIYKRRRDIQISSWTVQMYGGR